MIAVLATRGVFPKRVRYEHPDNGTLWQRRMTKQLLVPGQVYEVERVEQDTWFTSVYLRGYKGGFNSEMFDLA